MFARLRGGRDGFSLVELMVTIGVLAILAALTLPSLSGLVTAGGVNAAASGISQLLEQARAYAMGHNTYVWVGFYQEANPSQLLVGAVAGNTGQSTDLSAATTYTSVARTQAYSQIKLVSPSSLPNKTDLKLTDTPIPIDFSATTANPTFALPNRSPAANYQQVLQYDPQGAVTVLGATAGDAHQVQIGLQPAAANPANDAVIEVATMTGQARLLRP